MSVSIVADIEKSEATAEDKMRKKEELMRDFAVKASAFIP